jgi:hypothetical protein
MFMKIIKTVSHPILVITFFLFLIINRESISGFYALYNLLGLFDGIFHSIMDMAGIILMVVGYRLKSTSWCLMCPWLYLSGVTLKITALYVFFQQSKGYNDQTFNQIFPLTTFIVFGIVVLCNISLAISLLRNNHAMQEKVLASFHYKVYC